MTPDIFIFLSNIPILIIVATLGYIIASYTILPEIGLKQNLRILLVEGESLKATAIELEKSFGENINFQNLSRGFSTLANYLETVNKFIVSIEMLEKKANKGNLFDSTKYINSLKGDIVKPLVALKSLLEKKKTELEANKQEIKKVRVRIGGNGERENLNLTSKRTESLIQELTENIEKLDRMIEKF